MHLPAEELHRLAWEIIEPLFRQARDRFRQHVHNRRAADQLAAILELAPFGHIDTRFVMEGNQRFGKFVPKTTHTQELTEGILAASLCSVKQQRKPSSTVVRRTYFRQRYHPTYQRFPRRCCDCNLGPGL